jgi:hypothetical protein
VPPQRDSGKADTSWRPWPWPEWINHRCPSCGFDRPRQGHRDGCPDGAKELASAAYRAFLCVTCRERRYRAGGTQCEERYRAARGLT